MNEDQIEDFSDWWVAIWWANRRAAQYRRKFTVTRTGDLVDWPWRVQSA